MHSTHTTHISIRPSVNLSEIRFGHGYNVRFFGGKSGLDEEDFLNPIEEFSFAYIQEVLKCIGPEVESCHMKREHEDELLPDGYDDLSSLSAVLRPLDFRGGGPDVMRDWGGMNNFANNSFFYHVLGNQGFVGYNGAATSQSVVVAVAPAALDAIP